MEIKSKVTEDGLRIFINGILHLFITCGILNTVYSYYQDNEDKTGCRYYIELTLKDNGLIMLSYSTFDKWEKVLKILNKQIS